MHEVRIPWPRFAVWVSKLVRSGSPPKGRVLKKETIAALVVIGITSSSSSSSSRHGSDSVEVSRWLPNRLRASTFVSRGPDQAPFPNDYGFLSTDEPCATCTVKTSEQPGPNSWTQSLSKTRAYWAGGSARWRKSLSLLCDEIADGAATSALTKLFSDSEEILQACLQQGCCQSVSGFVQGPTSDSDNAEAHG